MAPVGTSLQITLDEHLHIHGIQKGVSIPDAYTTYKIVSNKTS